ncbi:hypothetical protein EXN66_Car001850 [Channa argus]|uniref:Uncharacterized protein n=1 Tax=Channa argus TaxID=215402 RepID=A0A6G1P7Z9_CHAAH|nr:hypothetical protein EXN66_Car001850 [Channa argus]
MGPNILVASCLLQANNQTVELEQSLRGSNKEACCQLQMFPFDLKSIYSPLSSFH